MGLFIAVGILCFFSILLSCVIRFIKSKNEVNRRTILNQSRSHSTNQTETIVNEQNDIHLNRSKSLLSYNKYMLSEPKSDFLPSYNDYLKRLP